MALGGLIGSRPSAAAASNGHHGTGRALLATSLRARLRRESQEARTASAKVANRRPQGVSTLGVREWQEAAMRYHDTVGEVRYCTRFLSRTLSRLDVYPARVDENGDPRPIDPQTTDRDEQLALQLWDQVQDPTGGRSQLFGRYAALRFISGESYLLASREKPDEDDLLGSQPPVDWAIVSIWELSIRDGSYRVDSEDGYEEFKIADSATGEIMPGQAIAWRLWLPHPRRRREPDSPMRPLLDVLEELRLLRLSVRSRARNRAANTDILIIPDEAFPLPNSVGDSDETLSGGAGTGAATDEDLEEDPVLDRLLETMLTPLRDEGDASAAVPPVLRVPNEYVNSFQTVSIYNRADAFPEKALRDECVIAFARGVDLPPEVVIGLADINHWCEISSTLIYTRARGWCSHEELRVGDEVRTLNHETGFSEWQPVLDIYRAEVEDLPMRRISRRFHESCSTPNHRWPVIRNGERVWATNETLQADDRIIRSAPADDLPSDPVYSDEFVELVAWFVTEGTCTWPTENYCQVRIGQSHKANPGMVARIRRTLESIYGEPVETMVRGPGVPRGATVPPRWKEVAEPRGMTLFHLNKTAYAPLLDVMESWRSKVVRREFIESLTLAQLGLFLHTCALGDGLENPAGGLSISQRKASRMAPIELAAILAGRAIRRLVRMSGGFRQEEQQYLSVHAGNETVRVVDQSEETYTGTIWCPVTENQTWLAQESGHVYYTGNTAWQVDEQTWHHIDPTAQEMVGEFTTSFFRPTLVRQGVADPGSFLLWYSPARILVKPDRAKDANDAYDRNAISWEAYRDAMNWDEDDAPSDSELIFRSELVRSRYTVQQTPGQQSDTAPPAPVPPATDPNAPPEAPTEGARAVALYRCREKAGSRLRARLTPAERAEHKNTSNVRLAAVLGAERVAALGLRADRLVEGGADCLIAALESQLGYPEAVLVAAETEQRAAETLYDARPADVH